MTLTLYGGAGTRAAMVRWYLEEKAIPHQQVELDLRAGAQRQPAFLAINPFAKVPALVDEAFTAPAGGPLKLFESGAILLHLAEHHGHEFDGDPAAAAVRRSLTAQWLLFANASLGPAMFMVATRPEALSQPLSVLDGLLANGSGLLAGGGVDPGWGAADCVVQAYLAYLPMFCRDFDLSPYPHVGATIAATEKRPAYRLAMGTGA